MKPAPRPRTPRTIAARAACLLLCLAFAGCAAVDVATEVIENRPPKPQIDDEENPIVVIETNKGALTAELDERGARNSVAYFLYLVEANAYANRTFYKADAKTVDAGPRAKPIGFRIKAEHGRQGHVRYALSIKGDPDGALTADVMIVRQDSFDLDKDNVVIGRIIGGTWALRRIRQGDVIRRIYVKRKKSHPYAPTVESNGRIRTDPY